MSTPPRAVQSGRAAVAVALRVLGVTALVGVAATVWLGLFVTPPDEFMGNLVRLLYVHPPMAWVAFLAYGVASLASLLYLWPRTRAERFDRLAGASAEVGVVFTGLTLVSGSIWGRPTWGAWWVWDPLLTTTALLFVLYLGYLALRRPASSMSALAGRR
jgi:heme exporter protein C